MQIIKRIIFEIFMKGFLPAVCKLKKKNHFK